MITLHTRTLNIQRQLLSSALTTDPLLACNHLSDLPLEKDPIQMQRWEDFNLEVSLYKGAVLFGIDHPLAPACEQNHSTDQQIVH